MRRTVAAWTVTLAVSMAFYWREAALEHFVWHLGYGASFGVVLGVAWSTWRAERLRRVAWWALGGYAFMIVPDLLWLAPRALGHPPWAHEPWMDIFLAHVSLDHWRWAWPAMPLVVSAALALVVWNRVQTRPRSVGAR